MNHLIAKAVRADGSAEKTNLERFAPNRNTRVGRYQSCAGCGERTAQMYCATCRSWFTVHESHINQRKALQSLGLL